MIKTKNKNYRVIYLIISLFFILTPRIISPPIGMTNSAFNILGIFLACLTLWMLEGIDWPSILCIGLIGTIPEIGLASALKSAFGSDTFAFLMFTFLCTYAVSKTSFLKRCAIRFITSKFSKRGAWHFVISFFSAVILMGCFMSPTVIFILFLPILEEIFNLLDIKKGEKVGEMLIIGLAFCVSISSGMTPIAHVFSVMAMGFYEAATGISISYASYMFAMIPVGIICVIFLLLVFKFILRPDLKKLENIDISSLKSEIEPIRKKEIFVVAVFIFVILLWVLPGIFTNPVFTLIKSYGSAFPPIVGIILYCLVKFDNESVLNIADGMKNGIPWPSLIMAGATLSLGAALTNDDIGLKTYLIDMLSPILQTIAPSLLVIIFIAWACIQTNLSSNMVTVTVVTNVAIPILLAYGSDINTAGVVSLIGMMGAYAFATPPAMPHIAISAASGWTNTQSMFKYGFIFMIITTLVASFIGYPLTTIFM